MFIECFSLFLSRSAFIWNWPGNIAVWLAFRQRAALVEGPSTRNRFSNRPYLFICRLSHVAFLYRDIQFPAGRPSTSGLFCLPPSVLRIRIYMCYISFFLPFSVTLSPKHRESRLRDRTGDLFVRNLIMRARNLGKESTWNKTGFEILASHAAPCLFILFLQAKLQTCMMHRNRTVFFCPGKLLTFSQPKRCKIVN